MNILPLCNKVRRLAYMKKSVIKIYILTLVVLLMVCVPGMAKTIRSNDGRIKNSGVWQTTRRYVLNPLKYHYGKTSVLCIQSLFKYNNYKHHKESNQTKR